MTYRTYRPPRWTFHEAGGSGEHHPAEVPGCVHTDLLRNRLIPDPFYGSNEQQLQWIGEKDWVYRTTFDLAPDLLKQTHVDLVFEGLDTYAEVTLNGAPILSANNMFREWRVACKSLFQERGNALEIRFRNVFGETLPRYQNAPYRLQAFGTNDQADVKVAMYSRKAQFHFGWDWGPRLVTCGIWRPVLVEAWSGAKIRSVFVQQEHVSAQGADIVSVIEIESDTAQPAAISVNMDEAQLNVEGHDLRPGFNRVTLRGRLQRPRLWWTSGLGAQHLYEYRARVEAGNAAAEYTTKIGVRSLEVVREKDASGTTFFLRLNGVPVFMKGANYVPQDNFQNRVTQERYEHVIRSAAGAHMNMLRLWGGGIFEEDAFYDACDRYGILVWHDMQFACAMYPADKAFLDNVRQEVIDNVARIRNHACLALYCGNNENEACWHQFGWKKLYPPGIQAQHEADMRALYHETIPQALREADPTRYYHLSSPNAGFNNVGGGEGDIHYWGVWHGKEPFETYLSNLARFVSEYGFQSYPELSTVKKFAAPADRTLHSEVMLSHQRCMADERRDREYGNRLIQLYLDRWYRTPKDFEAYLYVSQVQQADGVRLAMEAHRRAMPYCMGSLYWQIDDCWPVASWSSIDYYGRWKALHYAARRSFAPVLLSAVIQVQEAEFHVVNDALEAFEAELEVRVLDFDGAEVSRTTRAIKVAANASERHLVLPRLDLTRGRDETTLVIVSRLIERSPISSRDRQRDESRQAAGGTTAFTRNPPQLLAESINYFRLPKELKLAPAGIELKLTPGENAYAIQVWSRVLARSVMLSCGDDEGFFSDNYFDLLPGEAKIVEYRTGLDQDSVEAALKAMSLGDSAREGEVAG